MPIVIKELFPSDPISEAVEKINFNFDQLLLAGGGPPGPPGPIGPPGAVGPQGTRGDHWFVGASAFGQTADHDGNSPLKVEDHFLDINGDVYSYFDNGLGSTGWTYSGINLVGPPGPAGSTGGSYEWTLYGGTFGNALSGTAFTYGPNPSDPLLVDNSNLNFIVPIGATKNTLLIGDPNWFYNSLQRWNSINQSIGGPTVFEEGAPRLALIQRRVDYFGVNGFSIGAYGLTGGTSISPISPSSGISSNQVDSRDFFHIGLAMARSSSQEQSGPLYYSHVGSLKTFTRDILIEAGESTLSLGTTGNTIRLRSGNYHYENFDGTRWISSGSTSILPGIIDDYISINSFTSSPNRRGWVGLQNYMGPFGAGPVVIGPVSVGNQTPWYGTTGEVNLLLSRRTSAWNTNQASIGFTHDINAGNFNDLIAKIVAVSPTPGFNIDGTLQIVGNFIGINGWRLTMDVNQKPLFPLHVNQWGRTLPSGNPWSTAPVPFTNRGWLVGFDKSDSSTIPPFNFSSRGLGINYVQNVNGPYSVDEIVLQSYWTKFPNNGLQDPGSPLDFSATLGTARTAPHLYTQIGYEESSGNFGIGLSPTTGRLAWSKLSVNGSVRIGSTYGNTFSSNGNNLPFLNGLWSEGRIIQGFNFTINDISTESFPTFAGLSGAFGATVGFVSKGSNISRTFISKEVGSLTDIAFALGDTRTGMRLVSTSEGRLTVAPTGSTSGIGTSTGATDALRFSGVGDFGSTGPVPGVQVSRRFSQQPLYMTTQDLYNTMRYCVYTNSLITPPGRKAYYQKFVIPSTHSQVVFDLSGFINGYQLPSSPPTWNSSANRWVMNSSPNNSTPINPIYLNYNNANTLFGPGSIPQLNYQQYTIQDGEYDGQELTLTFFDVKHNNTISASQGSNMFMITPHRPVGVELSFNGSGQWTGPIGQAGAISSPFGTTIPDYISMSKELVFGQAGQEPNYTSMFPGFGPINEPGGTAQLPYFGGFTLFGVIANTSGPWPWPSNTTPPNLGVTPPNLAVPNVLLDTSIGTPASDINYSIYNYYGSFTTGWGWRSIKFKWLRLAGSPTSKAGYMWVEVSREYLSRPGITNYVSASNGYTQQQSVS